LILWRHFGFEFVLVLILCAASLFFFPVAHGSYSAVHGPVTVLQSIKNRLRMWLISAIAAHRLFSKRLLAANSHRLFHAFKDPRLSVSGSAQLPVLRC
jgi:hypothetical protein